MSPHAHGTSSPSTSSPEFRQLVNRLASLLAYEATKDLRTETVEVQTPLTQTAGKRLAERIGLIPILRAGLAMVDPVLELIPSAEVWHLGLYRDEETAQPVKYYSKLPPERPVDVALVLDPMLATGGSAVDALTTDDSILAGYAAQDQYKGQFKLAGLKLSNENYGIGVKKGDTEMVNKINAALEKMVKDKAWEKAVEENFGPADYKYEPAPKIGNIVQ